MSNTDLLIRPVVNQNATPAAVAGSTSTGSVTIPAVTVTVTPAVVAASTTVGTIFPAPVGQAAGVWSGVFRDEFTGASVTILNSNETTGGTVRLSPGGPVWKAWYPNDAVGDGNQHSNNPATEKEYYDFSGLTLDGVSVLTLTATKDNVHGALPYTSGLIQSNPTFNPLYGYFEARIRMNGFGTGGWPAFWTASSTFEWPPELDIMENSGYSTTFYTMSNQTSGRTVFGNSQSTDLTQWHVYGLKWSSGHATWYLDGTQVANETNAASVPSVAMYLIVNIAMEGTSATSASMDVDYVRGWQ